MSERGEALAGRLFEALLGTADLLNVYLGDRLGLYAELAEGGPATSTELAARAGIAERYAREWLEQQAVGGIIECDDPSAGERERSYSLPSEYAEVLVDPDSQSFLAPMARMFVAASQQLPALMEAFRSGGGVGWGRYGPDMSEGQEAGNRPFYMGSMGDWIAGGLPDVHERLSAEGAKVADIGCGGGWSSISIARAYPRAQVRGLDLDEPAVERARANAEGAGGRRPGDLPRGRPARSGADRSLRPRHRVRMHPRHAASGAGPRDDALDRGRGGRGDGDGRGGRGGVHRSRRRARTADVRVQHARVPARRDGGTRTRSARGP